MAISTSTFSLNVSAIKALCSGNTLLNGTSVPATSTGNTGDFYINTSSNIIYGPKSATTFWNLSTSIVGASGTSAAFNGTVATLSALSIYNTAQTGLIVSSTGFPSAYFNSTLPNVLSVYSNNVPLLLLNSTTTILSSNATVIGGNPTLNDSVTIPLVSGNFLNIGSVVLVSGGYVLIGNNAIAATLSTVATSPILSAFNVGITTSRAIVASMALAVTDSTGVYGNFVTYSDPVVRKFAFNVPLSGASNLSAFSADFTVNGSISSTATVFANNISLPITLAPISSRTINTPVTIYRGTTTSPTWTMPPLSSNQGMIYYFKHAGSTTVTLTAAPNSTDQFWLTAASTFLSITSANSPIRLIGNTVGGYWDSI